MFDLKLDSHSSIYPYMQDYVRERDLRGLGSANELKMLRSLERYSVRIGYNGTGLTKELYNGWADDLEVSDQCKPLYMRAFMRFSLYMNRIGVESYMGPLPKYVSDFTPYIYSEAEMEQLFSAADNWREKNFDRRSCAMVMPVLLRVLYSTAMRVGEALSIVNKNVDFKRHLIILGKTKNRRDRCCAMPPSLETVIREYMHFRDMLPVDGIADPDSLLFRCFNGKPVRQLAVRHRFHALQRSIGMHALANGKLPRLHDIRHTACVNAMRKLMAAGKDIYCCMPQLAAYMGHYDTSSTERYLRLTSSVFPELLEMAGNVTMPINDVVNQRLAEIKNEANGKL